MLLSTQEVIYDSGGYRWLSKKRFKPINKLKNYFIEYIYIYNVTIYYQHVSPKIYICNPVIVKDIGYC